MLRVLIADDEPHARRRLRKLLKPLVDAKRLTIEGEAADGKEALELLGSSDIDLVFLDIRMPECDGFEVIDRLDAARRPITIFVTAYDEHALKAFEANAVDYLPKPIERRRLNEAVERAEQMKRTSADGERLTRLLEWIESNGANEEEYISQITIPVRDRTLVVPVTDIISAEINEGITRLFTLEDDAPGGRSRVRQHVVNYTLEQLDESLDPAQFMRVHRSAIVQMAHIREMVSWHSGRLKLIMTGGHEVIASRDRSRELKGRLSL